MKTAISLPDALYKDVELVAESLGIPRSQLYAKALGEFILHHKKELITGKLDEVYGKEANRIVEGSLPASLDSMRELTRHDSW